MNDDLITLGLTPAQAEVYLYLLRQSSATKPMKISKAIQQTRTNTYKVLNSLIEIGLVNRRGEGATYSYEAEDPVALTNIASRARNEAIRLERQVKDIVPSLKSMHDKRRGDAATKVAKGRLGIIAAYNTHLAQAGDMHFIRSRSDIPFLGFEVAHKMRSAARGIRRFGITPDAPDASNNPELDKKTGLVRTWVGQDTYTSSVEWSVKGDQLIIINYAGDGQVISIHNPDVAEAFCQLWGLLDDKIRLDPEYKLLPKKAEREI